MKKGSKTGVKYLNNNMIAIDDRMNRKSLTVLSNVNGLEKGEIILTFINFSKCFV